MREDLYVVSDMLKVTPWSSDAAPSLSKAIISRHTVLPDFAAMQKHVLSLRYPRAGHTKDECYGWTATFFNECEHTFNRNTDKAYTRYGTFRNGDAEVDACACFVADIDNANGDIPFVTRDQTTDRLNDIFGPLNWFTYTSFSHTPSKHKFRLAVDTTRIVTRTESLMLACWLNQHAFGLQADMSIYDPSDFLYAPPNATTTTNSIGEALDPDLMLQLISDDQAVIDLIAGVMVKRERQRNNYKPTEEEKQAAMALRADTAFGAVTIADPRIWNPDWDAEHLAYAKGHWETMRSSIAKIWAKSGGSLTKGEMQTLLAELDAMWGGYYTAKYGNRVDDIIDWVMGFYPEPNVALTDRPGDLLRMERRIKELSEKKR